MPSITLTNLSFSTPDGRGLFTGLDLAFGPERAGLVGRNGVGKTTLLRLILGELSPASGTVSVSGGLAVLRQRNEAAPGETVADLFGVAAGLGILRRAEAGEATGADLADADWTLEGRVAAALARVNLTVGVETPLATLSGGQRTRASLAALVFAEPDILLLDEPTNDLDADGRRAVADLVAGWRGAAVVVSHDRELLETMDAIVELTTLGATRYGGGWSRYREQKELELAAARQGLADAEKRAADVARGAQQSAERQARKDAGGRRKAARGDAPRILLGMMKNRSEETAASAARLAERRLAEADAALVSARQRIEVLQPLAVSLPPTGLMDGKPVLRMEGVSFGHQPGRPVIEDFSLSITGPERVAIVGANGAGKSTLLALATGALEPWEGTVSSGAPTAMLDQSVSLLQPERSIRDNFLRLHPASDENACRAALARFMFRADAALQTVGELSGGQRLRAGLACVLGGPHPPQLLILDEPTNHLDLDAIEAVEAGLRAFDGALLLVSHDEAFLEGVCVTRRVALQTGVR